MTRRLFVLCALSVLMLLGRQAGTAAARGPSDHLSRDTIPIRGPTLVAYFAVTQAEVDADGDAMEALSDFQHYLPAIAKGLAACGVAMVETYESTIGLLRGDSVEIFTPRELEVRVGYLLMRPDRPDLTLEGVHTDVDLLTTAVGYFEVPESCWQSVNPG